MTTHILIHSCTIRSEHFLGTVYTARIYGHTVLKYTNTVKNGLFWPKTPNIRSNIHRMPNGRIRMVQLWFDHTATMTGTVTYLKLLIQSPGSLLCCTYFRSYSYLDAFPVYHDRIRSAATRLRHACKAVPSRSFSMQTVKATAFTILSWKAEHVRICINNSDMCTSTSLVSA